MSIIIADRTILSVYFDFSPIVQPRIKDVPYLNINELSLPFTPQLIACDLLTFYIIYLFTMSIVYCLYAFTRTMLNNSQNFVLFTDVAQASSILVIQARQNHQSGSDRMMHHPLTPEW